MSCHLSSPAGSDPHHQREEIIVARVVPRDEDEYASICMNMQAHASIAIDTETTGLSTYQDDVIRGLRSRVG